jgi:glycerol-3-phosphate dehydrogenase (NAD(P)+)
VIGVVGAGAFGTALAIALSRDGGLVRLWARDHDTVQRLTTDRTHTTRLPGAAFPDSLQITGRLADLAGASLILLTLPMQALRAFLAEHAAVLDGLPLIACCKGVDLTTLRGPTAIIGAACPSSPNGILTGPSFAADIARGLPTALTLASSSTAAEAWQHCLSTPALRVYRSADVIGAELGGALKNVMAIAAGVVVGYGLGDSARAALMTRGYAELQRFAVAFGAQPETLAGLSGLGDLVLTCTSLQSRNLRYGIALGSGTEFDRSQTVEGASTAPAVLRLAAEHGVAMPITEMVAQLIDRKIPLDSAITTLMSRPLKQE